MTIKESNKTRERDMLYGTGGGNISEKSWIRDLPLTLKRKKIQKKDQIKQKLE